MINSKPGPAYSCAVSICLPTCDSASFVARMLDSILSQTLEDFECIVSDDASSDATVEICRRFAANDPRIKVHRHPHRLGWVGNVNRALELASGKYLMIAPHDDELAPDYLRSLVAALEANPRAAVAFSDIEVLYPEGDREVLSYRALDGLASPVERGRRIVAHGGAWHIPYRGVVPSKVYKKVGGLRKHRAGEFSADRPWILGLAIAGEFERVAGVLYTKYRRWSSLSRSWSFTEWQWVAVWLACSATVARSELPMVRALPIYSALTRVITRSTFRGAKQSYSAIRRTRFAPGSSPADNGNSAGKSKKRT